MTEFSEYNGSTWAKSTLKYVMKAVLTLASVKIEDEVRVYKTIS